MNLRIYLEDQLKVLILLHKLGQNAILERPAMPRLSYIALLWAHIGMLSHHT